MYSDECKKVQYHWFQLRLVDRQHFRLAFTHNTAGVTTFISSTAHSIRHHTINIICSTCHIINIQDVTLLCDIRIHSLKLCRHSWQSMLIWYSKV